MHWFSEKRSKRILDYTIRNLITLQKFFVILALIITISGVFVTPLSYFYKNSAVDEKSIDTNALEKANYYDVSSSDIPIDTEVLNLRSINQKVFKKVDGTYEVNVYQDVIHYLNNEGKYIDIDNSLEEKDNEFGNKDNLYDIKFPKTLNSNQKIKLSISDYQIDWSLINFGISNGTKKNNEIDEKNKAYLNKLSSSILYENVLPFTDIEYILKGNQIKENIYISEYSPNIEFIYEYYLKDLTLFENEKGSLVFVNDYKETIFSFDNLFMLDYNGYSSNDIKVNYEEIKKDTYRIIVKPSEEWLKEATYPIIIDPTISTPSSQITISDTYVSEAAYTSNYDNQATMKIGGYYEDEYCGLIKFNLPDVLDDQVITFAHLALSRTDKRFDQNGNFIGYASPFDLQVNVHKNIDNFNASTVSWYSRPAYEAQVIDYFRYQNTPSVNTAYEINFDVTEAVKDWQAGISPNYGLTLTADSINDLYKEVYQNNVSYSSIRPFIRIGYENPSGLKDYWTYTSQELGNLGTGYVSDYTGNLTFVRNEYALNSEFMPLNLMFFYNNFTRNNNIGFGNGWKTNYNMKVLFDENTSSYYLDKPDGNIVYFSFVRTEYDDDYVYDIYIAEDGSKSELIVCKDILNYDVVDFTINTVDDIKFYFSFIGKLINITNTKNNQFINIYYYGTSDRITYVRDLVGNRIDFTYNSSNQLIRTDLKLKQPNSSTYNTVEYKTYTYTEVDNTKELLIKNYYKYKETLYSEGENLYYYFDDSNRLVNIYNSIGGNQLDYTYNLKSQVSEILATDKVSSENIYNLSKLTIAYEDGKTRYTNQEGKWVDYSFDEYGHTINILDSYGNATYQRYAGLFAYTDNFNQTLDLAEIINLPPNYNIVHSKVETSQPMNQKLNYIKNHGFEEDTLKWVKNGNGSISKDSTMSALGLSSLKVINNGETYAYQNVTLPSGNYQLTGLVKNFGVISGNSSINISFGSSSYSDSTSESNEWTQLSVNFELVATTTITIKLINSRNNTATNFDNIQLTEGFIDTRYNALSNSSFEEGVSNWQLSGASILSNNSSTEANQNILGSKSLKIEADGGEYKYFYQEITDLVTEEETYIIGGWAKANAVPHKGIYNQSLGLTSDSRFFGLAVVYQYYDENPSSDWPDTGTIYLPFDSSIENWQYQMRSFKIDVYNIVNVKLYGIYQGEGMAYFDNIQFYHDKISTEYCYDIDNGNLTSTTNSSGETTTFTYDENNKVEEVNQNNQSITIDYTSSYLVTDVSANNVKTSFVYNSTTKQIAQTIIGDYEDGEYFSTSTSYTSDNQYVSSVKDEFGNTTTNTTNSLNGLVETITNANNQVTAFEYDNYGNITSQINGQVIKEFSYDDQKRINEITIDSVTYAISYDDFDRITNITIANANYVTLTYLNDSFNSTTYQTDKINTQAYQNGDTYTFTYTDEGQVASISFEDENDNSSVWFSYSYDQAGRMTIYRDLLNDDIYFYSYDLAGKLKQITDQNDNKINFTYDSDGNVNSYAYSGIDYELEYKEIRKVYYCYNELTGEYDHTYYDIGDNDIYKYYNIDTDDSLRRLDNIQLVISATLNYSEHYQYQTPDPTIGTGNASLLVASITYKKNDIITATHTFTYDKLYNITSIIIDNNGSNDESYAYTYDYLNRLIREDITTINYSGYRTYEYDLRGNITSIQVWEYRQNGEDIVEVLIADKLITYKTEGWKDQISTLSEQLEGESVETIYTYTYDEIGNVTKISVSDNDYDTFSWDGRRLKQYIKDGVTYSYTYNDEGIRTSKTIDGIKTTYFLDGYNVLIEKTNGNVIYYTYDADGSLLSMNYNGTEYFYIKNMQGDIIELVNVLGDSIAKYRYDAWGNIIYQYDSGLGIADINPYRYRGYRFDIETGLYYLNARYYDSNIGRFISSDSISYLDPSSEAGLNLYAYCNNNPVLNVDPTGCWSWTNFWIGTAATLVAVAAVATILIAAPVITAIAVVAIVATAVTGAVLTYGTAAEETIVIDVSYSTPFITPVTNLKVGVSLVADFEEGSLELYGHGGGSGGLSSGLSYSIGFVENYNGKGTYSKEFYGVGGGWFTGFDYSYDGNTNSDQSVSAKLITFGKGFGIYLGFDYYIPLIYDGRN